MGPEHSHQHSCWSCSELCTEYHAHPHSLACLRPPSERMHGGVGWKARSPRLSVATGATRRMAEPNPNPQTVPEPPHTHLLCPHYPADPRLGWDSSPSVEWLRGNREVLVQSGLLNLLSCH